MLNRRYSQFGSGSAVGDQRGGHTHDALTKVVNLISKHLSCCATSSKDGIFVLKLVGTETHRQEQNRTIQEATFLPGSGVAFAVHEEV